MSPSCPHTRPATAPRTSRVFAALSLLAGLTLAGPALAVDSPQLARGRYLVEGIAACGNCHTPRDDQGAKLHERGLVGGSRWQLPTATVYAPNITPDVETGIGGWSDAQIGRAIREGVRPDGRVLAIMPIPGYRQLADDDLAAIVAWLRAQPARRNPVPPSEFRGDPPKPYGPPITEPQGAPPRDDLVRWGAYLAGPLGHCMSCHTPRGPDGRPDLREAGAGGNRYPGPWGVSVSRNLTPDASGLRDWSDAEIERAIREGVRRDGALLLPPMDFASYRGIDAHDMRALIAYLRSLAPRPSGGTAAVVAR